MASTTTHLNLKLLGTSQEDKAKYFEDWRQDINGEDGESNMQIIDQAYHELDENKIDSGYVEDGVAYFTANNAVKFTITGIGGGGGGGGSSTGTLTVSNTTGWLTTKVVAGAKVNLTFTWSSTDEDIPTGDGTLTIRVNDVIKDVRGISQGPVTVAVTDFLEADLNVIRLTVADVNGNNRVITFNVTVTDVRIESAFDSSVVQTGDITFSYTPWGDMQKTVHFYVDGGEVGTSSTSVSGREQTYVISALEHGAHAIEVVFTGELSGAPIRSNVLHYDIICVEDGVNTPVIASDYNETEIAQYSTAVIPYMVYTPNTQVSAVTIELNGAVVQNLPFVDRSVQTFSYRFDEYGAQTVVIRSGTASKSISFTVRQSDITIEPVTANLALYLNAKGRSNQEANPGTWVSGDVTCSFSGFNFISDGWVTDKDGATVLRVGSSAEVVIPYKLFGTDFRATGKTIEIEFATRDVRNYSSVLIDCMDNGRGLQVTAQDCRIASEQSGLQTQFKEDEHVRVSFVVDKRSELRLIRCYINSVLSAVVRYPTNDDFTQMTPQNITIHGNGNVIDIYCIRVYNSDLNMEQIEENWIADTSDAALMLERYSHNDIRNVYGKIITANLPSDLPYMIITASSLPQYKGNKLTCSGSYTDPLNPDKSFTFQDAEIDVQGTSSQYYRRKNYKVKFNGGFINSKGTVSSKYKMRDDSIAVKTFCFKADVASSEGANNVELARLYEEACPYRTPAQNTNSNVRQGIDGFPMVIFWNNPDTGDVSFLGKYNFNNDKSTEDVFGFVEGDESWEVKNNTGNRVVWRSDDYTGKAWLNDFEARYPDTKPAYEDPTQLKALATWLRSTDATQATNDALATPVTYPSIVTTYEEHEDLDTGEISYEEVKSTVQVTYTNDTAEYRKAKFRAELSNYVEVDSAIFYYLFTELFLMVDSRAKNMFPSFMGSEVSA